MGTALLHDAPKPPLAYPEHASSILEQAIVSGALEPGRRVTEVELSAMLGISRTPIREATRILEARGLIVRRQNRGTYIASRTTRAEAEALYKSRAPLEAYLAGCAASAGDHGMGEALPKIQAEFRQALSRGAHEDGHDELIQLDSEFHWTIYRAAGTDLTSIVESYWGRLQRELSARTYGSGPPARFADQHDGIAAALAAGDPGRSAELMTRHIEASWLAVSRSYDQEDASGVGSGG